MDVFYRSVNLSRLDLKYGRNSAQTMRGLNKNELPSISTQTSLNFFTRFVCISDRIPYIIRVVIKLITDCTRKQTNHLLICTLFAQNNEITS